MELSNLLTNATTFCKVKSPIFNFSITIALLFITPFAKFFEFEALSFFQLFSSVATGFITVIWYEVVKWNKRRTSQL